MNDRSLTEGQRTSAVAMYGKSYMGIERSTFLIDGTGTVRDVWRKVKVPGHAEAVLEAVRGL